ncbi:5-formyltetrahydrofolate cyclo-ligase [Deinococcus metalli]|uniref:5-formyltetrahydrofolate cyclo-ligase n=1 Tax=Deinococcus metalli TaxID=1141878 RepID=A0A7W8KDM2_9DEIO|nr:5-formyltetrahydrofolate cyclo-ligase [Deinococcus metalli]MBB5376005.1 5-formyltetrahydrofolate cyclo-ligase [Deinococcus metalli]GHF41526.1 5-formyltetrahydrofolate cyclo-ligase [Deinococcus metalli]
MRPPPPTAPKSEWRAWARAARAALPDVSDAVTAHLRAFLHAHGFQRVLAYRALPGEPDVGALADDFELLTTRARFRPEPRLTLHPWHTATEPSAFGALQPPRDAPQVALHDVHAILLPALAYDTHGRRLGYGGGFYDRLLPAYRGVTVGVVQHALLVPDLPGEAHDCPVAWVATEDGLRRAGGDSP